MCRFFVAWKSLEFAGVGQAWPAGPRASRSAARSESSNSPLSRVRQGALQCSDDLKKTLLVWLPRPSTAKIVSLRVMYLGHDTAAFRVFLTSKIDTKMEDRERYAVRMINASAVKVLKPER